jgi:hypothetical protein
LKVDEDCRKLLYDVTIVLPYDVRTLGAPPFRQLNASIHCFLDRVTPMFEQCHTHSQQHRRKVTLNIAAYNDGIKPMML